MNSHEVFIHIHQGCFAGTGAIVRLPQCQWSKPDGYGKISQCITTTKHSKAKTVCIFLGIYCIHYRVARDCKTFCMSCHYFARFYVPVKGWGHICGGQRQVNMGYGIRGLHTFRTRTWRDATWTRVPITRTETPCLQQKKELVITVCQVDTWTQLSYCTEIWRSTCENFGRISRMKTLTVYSRCLASLYSKVVTDDTP